MRIRPVNRFGGREGQIHRMMRSRNCGFKKSTAWCKYAPFFALAEIDQLNGWIGVSGTTVCACTGCNANGAYLRRTFNSQDNGKHWYFGNDVGPNDRRIRANTIHNVRSRAIVLPSHSIPDPVSFSIVRWHEDGSRVIVRSRGFCCTIPGRGSPCRCRWHRLAIEITQRPGIDARLDDTQNRYCFRHSCVLFWFLYY